MLTRTKNFAVKTGQPHFCQGGKNTEKMQSNGFFGNVKKTVCTGGAERSCNSRRAAGYAGFSRPFFGGRSAAEPGVAGTGADENSICQKPQKSVKH